MRILSLLATFAISGFAAADEPVKLSNGENFEGWVFDHVATGIWSVDAGVIVCNGNADGVLRTAVDYGNYELTYSWRWAPGSKSGNSGLLIHASDPRTHKIWPKCLEVQLHAGNAGDFILLGETVKVKDEENRLSGRRIPRTVADGVEKPVGEWNTMVVRVVKDSVNVDVNGKRVNEATRGSATKGAICFQSEGSVIHFRDITLKTLQP